MKNICLHLFILFSVSSFAGITLPDVFSDNLVLKQNSEVKLWGTSKANKKLTVTVSWSVEKYTTKADREGNWEVLINTPNGSFDPQEIIIKQCSSQRKISNVLLGEIWFCSGQSNMEMFFKGFKDQPVAGSDIALSLAHKENGVRMLTVARNLPEGPVLEGKGKWKLSDAKNLLYFSAVAYSFALELKEQLQVPIGIINSSYGGSTIEGWMRRELVEQYSDVNPDDFVPDSTRWRKPVAMYNGMICPYTQFAISGFIWYQGEGSVDRFATYKDKLVNLVEDWRYQWIEGDSLPFYIVEITPYLYDHPLESAMLREAQFSASRQLDNCEMVSTNDLLLNSEHSVAHPSQKKPIGMRLANLALYYNYGKLDLKPHSPSLVLYRIKGNEMELTLGHCYEGIQEQSEYVGFELAGEDKVFYTAKAILNQNRSSFLVSSPEVEAPVAVRYCFKHLQIGNVKNSECLPLIPFRTDRE